MKIQFVNYGVNQAKLPKNQPSRLREKGFSLIEVLVSATLLLIFLLFAVKIFNSFIGGNNLRLGKNRIEQEKETVGNLIRPDFENAGFNLISYQNHTYGSQDASFVSEGLYQALGRGQIMRIGTRGGTEYIQSKTLIGSETGSATATINFDAGISLVGEAGGYVTLSALKNESDGKFYLILDVGGESQTLAEHVPGTTYRVSILPDADGKAVLVTQLGETSSDNRQLARTINTRVPAGTIKVYAYIVNMNDQMRIELKGAPLIDSGDSRTLSNALFIDAESRGTIVSDFIYKTSDGNTTLLSGSLDSRIGFLQEPSEDFTSPKDIIVAQEVSGTVARAGDYGVLLDYQTGSSVLLKVTGVIEDSMGRLIYSVAPVQMDNPAWGRFYSTPDALGSRFNRGSRFIKLAPPITYRLSTQDNRLIRQSGNRSETVAFAVENFDVRQAADGRSFQIEMTIQSDASASGETGPKTRFSYTAQPRASTAENQTE